MRYRRETLEFPLKVVRQGFKTAYVVNVDGIDVVFERDVAGELRAVIYEQGHRATRLLKRGLIEAIKMCCANSSASTAAGLLHWAACLPVINDTLHRLHQHIIGSRLYKETLHR